MKMVNKIPDLILFAAGIATQIFICIYAILILAGCNTAPEKDPEYIGRWVYKSTEYLPELNQNVDLTLELEISDRGNYWVNGTAKLTAPDSNFTLYTEGGEWTETGNALYLVARNCAALNAVGSLEVTVCDPPTYTMPLNISNGIWTVPDPDGTIINYIKQ